MTDRGLIDTNVVSQIMQVRDEGLLPKLSRLPAGQAVLSSVTLAELEYGRHRKGQPDRLKNALDQILRRMDVLPWNQEAVTCYGAFGVKLEGKGLNLSDFDMMISAHAVAVKATFIQHEISQADMPAQLR